MEINTTEFPFLSTIGFMLTYRCTVACPHCIVKAGPNRKEEMNIEHCLSWLGQARNYRNGHIYGLALTGGEPFYNLENLYDTIDDPLTDDKEFLPSAPVNRAPPAGMSEQYPILAR